MLQESVVPSQTLELLKFLSPILADDGFYLAGGTALALRMGHRESIDLDFFTTEPFAPEQLSLKLQKLVGKIPRILQKTSGSLSLELCDTKLEFLLYDYQELAPREKLGGIVLASFADNVAMKLSALTARGSKKDFTDVAALLQEVSLTEMVAWFEKKYPQAGSFMLYKSLTWFEDAEEEPDPKFFHGQDWTGIKKAIVETVTK